eukprot:CAMPEP_0170760952 /NCGR_PEP_ID=MMETSP0733-20121128/1873_1 /TAXON_ID=186038 /ORGANISM="Fragilariopsis kerguelensis, Strain L26-C5" /LENGTH=419 /DNA_ID=CAMNT_0011100825 /DNA_START=250 /DNA_END=1506 /DNA_ORIENTATION=+
MKAKPISASGSTGALVQSLILYTGAMFTLIAINSVRDFLVQEGKFLFGLASLGGKSSYERDSAMYNCLNGKSILYSWPCSMSEAYADSNGITSKVVATCLSFTALLLMSCQLGRPSAFPIKAGYYGSIFNFFRMMAPAITLFFIPQISSVGRDNYTKSPGLYNRGKKIHAFTSYPGFLIAPLLELIAVVLNLASFFQNPRSNKLFPSDSNNDDETSAPWVGTLYKTLWVGTTVLRGIIAIAILYMAIHMHLHADPAQDACEVLKTIYGFTNEVSIGALVGSVYAFLAISQMCESSGRKLSSLIYITPLLMFVLWNTLHTISTKILSLDMKKNYLKVVNMPHGYFSKGVMSVMVDYLKMVKGFDDTGAVKLPSYDILKEHGAVKHPSYDILKELFGHSPTVEDFKKCSAILPAAELEKCN